MKRTKLFIYLIAMITVSVFYACQNSQNGNIEEVAAEAEEEITEEEIIEGEATEINLEEDFEELDYSAMKDIPRHWEQLTEIDGEVIILEPCDVQNPNIHLSFVPDEDGNPALNIGIGQDSQIFYPIAAEWVNDSQMKIISCEQKEFFFNWVDKEKGTASWTIPGLFTETEFTVSDKRDNYEIRKEECDDMY